MRATIAANVPAADGIALHALTLFGGALVFNAADLDAEPDVGLLDKLGLWAVQLASVLAAWPPAAGGGAPDVTFLLQASSLPYLTAMPGDARARVAWARRHAPVFAIAKAPGDGDVLLPNPYFRDLGEWDAEVEALLRRGARRKGAAWGRRVDKLHWRGSCSTRFEGVLPRLRVLLAWADRPGFDIAFSNACLARFWPHPERALSAEDVRTAATLHRRRSEPGDLSRFKYLLHLPGASAASYSRSLQMQVTAGAALLKLDNPYREFYYRGLLPGVHYLPVNVTTLGDSLAWLRAHDDAADAMGAALHRFAATHLRGAHVRDYWVQLLRAYAALQRFDVTLPARACVCPGRGSELPPAAVAARPQLAALPRCTAIPRC